MWKTLSQVSRGEKAEPWCLVSLGGEIGYIIIYHGRNGVHNKLEYEIIL